ncbi:glucans biosynthesis glucosyltransferase MdoH [Pseudomonas sp. MYb185]|uniref:glucans biosynthesis glucosyltransferase MdoH n=1 Tax=Pseudomonas sp. MYb185 TaxID=1848729 RepID=UPI000CFC1EB7|nr:glucans biosynthesis glucosyltransferase MdoH [Pseudomonas sp. MYb185]PRB77482.1 glucans biosynthesis glucosyltransferase MdoH [Pseudomonas sp. MYb185]
MLTRTETAETVDLAASRRRWRTVALLRRSLLLLLVGGQTLMASWFMLSVLPYQGGNGVEIGMLVLFAILFAWISFGFWIAVAGFILRRLGGDRYSLLRQQDAQTLAATPLARTAILMPIYHEPVERSLGGLSAVYRSLERTGQIEHFDFFILSDSRDPDIWLQEQAAWARLVHQLGAAGRLFYRRRQVNLNYKSGNVADFLRRWGRGYQYMVVLDADSLMAGDTLVRMVQLMQRHPAVGIVQSSPELLNGRSLFARVQQFSSQLYGPLFSTGLAAVQMGEAAFWGHNAILRIRPFMAHCGLRKLPGWGLFRGPIMSHDFVEAAYLGRAGHEVWLEPGLRESWEESPPSLVDELTRDKRWVKGNMQHLWLLLGSHKLRFAHRLALLNGIMSYLASPLWLAFLVLTTIATTRLMLWPINYFPDPHQLHPLWPQWQPYRAVSLVACTLFLLFVPKFLGLADAALTRRLRAFGGFLRLLGSVLLEILISALLAPIRMLSHSRYVAESLLNVNLRWAGQNRTSETGWLKALIYQAPGLILGLGWALFALWLKPMFFYWSLPVALPLIFAAPISVVLSRVQLGLSLKRHGWLMTAEEVFGARLLDDLVGNPLKGSPQPGFCESVIDPQHNALQTALGRSGRSGLRRQRLDALCQRCLQQGPDGLEQRELALLAQDAEAMTQLHRQVWRAAPQSVWGRLLQQQIVRRPERAPDTGQACLPMPAMLYDESSIQQIKRIPADGCLPDYSDHPGQ